MWIRWKARQPQRGKAWDAVLLKSYRDGGGKPCQQIVAFLGTLSVIEPRRLTPAQDRARERYLAWDLVRRGDSEFLALIPQDRMRRALATAKLFTGSLTGPSLRLQRLVRQVTERAKGRDNVNVFTARAMNRIEQAVEPAERDRLLAALRAGVKMRAGGRPVKEAR